MKIDLLKTNTQTFKSCLDNVSFAISATANPEGFTTFNSIVSALGLNAENAKCLAATAQNEIRIVVTNGSGRNFLIVPTAESPDNIGKLTLELLKVASSLHVKELLFTHFAFIHSKFPESHIETILKTLKEHKNDTTISSISWVIDPRFHDDMKRLLNRFF